jgi:hypothetical protein
MEKATLTISMPRPMKHFMAEQVREGQFSGESSPLPNFWRAPIWPSRRHGGKNWGKVRG